MLASIRLDLSQASAPPDLHGCQGYQETSPYNYHITFGSLARMSYVAWAELLNCSGLRLGVAVPLLSELSQAILYEYSIICFL